jgi:hypothetical protein
MNHVINKDLRLLVPHGIEGPDRSTKLTGEIRHYVGQNLGLSRVDVMALRGRQSEHRPKRGTIVQITHSKNKLLHGRSSVKIKEC